MRMTEFFLAPLMRLTDSIQGADYYLQFIAVEGDARGDGIGTMLITEYERQAKAIGAKRLCLDVSTGNEVALRFYDRHGYRREWEWPRTRFLPKLSVRLMKPL